VVAYSPEEEEIYKKVTGKKLNHRYIGQSTNLTLPPEMDYFLEKVLGTFPKYSPSINERLESLEVRVRKLEEEKSPQKNSKEITQADLVYEIYREELEKEHFGRVVAIDTDSGTIAGIGNNILEAYKDARRKSKNKKFSFKRIGYPFICRLR